MNMKLLALVPVLIIIVAIPLLYDKVPRNRWYGFRTSTSLSSDGLWYMSNRIAAKGMCIAGVIWLLTALILPHLMSDPQRAQVLAVWVGFVLTIAALLVSHQLASRPTNVK